MAVQQILARDVFLEAIQIDSIEARGRYIENACSSDRSLLAEVRVLLSAYDPDSDFMTVPAPEQGDVLRVLCELDEESIRPGTQVDRYETLELIGRGGMGSVFKARQIQPVSRIVALKVILPAFCTPTGITLFERERQTLAIMNHPGIVSVLDAGQTEDGRPFFVMEYVDGNPITQFCEEQQLSAEQRITIFLSLCDSVQHAHTRGIIHQDLKPSNVLTGIVDGRVVTKLLDFGIQTADRSELAEYPEFSSESHPVGGTPAYMSPEQSAGTSSRCDTRSDVYSMGIVLFQLLTGGKLKSNVSGGQSIGDAVKNSSLCRPSWSEFRCREMAWVIERATQQPPEDRYQSAADLAEDLTSFLKRDALRAAPPSKLYFARRVFTRHLVLFVSSAIVTLSLLSALVISLRQTHLARAAEADAQKYLGTSETEQQRYRELAWESSLQQAYANWKDGRLYETRMLLQQANNTLKDETGRFESRILTHAIQDYVQIIDLCSSAITEIQRIPETQQIVIACEDGKVRIVNVASGELLREINTPIPELHSLAISNDGKWIAVGGSDDPETRHCRLQMLDLASGTLVREFPSQPTTIESLRFSLDNSLLICGARYENPQVFRTSDGSLQQTIPSERRNRWLACSTDAIMVEEKTNAIRTAVLAFPNSSEATLLSTFQEWGCWMPTQQCFITVLSYGGDLLVYNATNHQHIGCLSGCQSPSCFSLSADGLALVAGSSQGDVMIWDLAPLFDPPPPNVLFPADVRYEWHDQVLPMMRPQLSVAACDAPIGCVAIDGSFVVAGTATGQLIRLNRAALDSPLQAAHDHDLLSSTKSLLWDESRDRLITGHRDESVVEWQIDPETGTVSKVRDLVAKNPASAASEWNGAIGAFTQSADSSRIGWWKQSNQSIEVLHRATDAVESVSMADLDVDWSDIAALRFSSDAQHIVVASSRHLAVTEMPPKSSQLRSVLLPNLAHGLTWCRRNQHIVVGVGTRIMIFDKQLQEIESLDVGGADVITLESNSDGSRLYSGHADGTLRAWLVSNSDFRLVWSRRMNEDRIASIVVREIDGVGVSADRLGQVALWWTTTGKPIGVLRDSRMTALEESLEDLRLYLPCQGNDLLYFCKYRHRPITLQRWSAED